MRGIANRQCYTYMWQDIRPGRVSAHFEAEVFASGKRIVWAFWEDSVDGMSTRSPPQLASAAGKSDVEREIVKLERRHPGWNEILASPLFESWLQTKRLEYQALCRKSKLAETVSLCIKDFLRSTITPAKVP